MYINMNYNIFATLLTYTHSVNRLYNSFYHSITELDYELKTSIA